MFFVPALVPERFPTLFTEDFSNGIGYWTAGTPPFEGPIGGPREVVDGVFRSYNWSYDNNHLTTKGGPGMLHLLAYADWQLWPDADFTNARIKLRARGVNFDPNGSQFICWITANHPYVPGKNVNWGFIAEPRTSQLQSGDWEDIEWVLSPDPSKWVFGKGNGIYDTFLSVQESLQNIYNIHFLMLGPDNVGHPTGTFELDSCSILYKRKTADPVIPPEQAEAVRFNGNTYLRRTSDLTGAADSKAGICSFWIKSASDGIEQYVLSNDGDYCVIDKRSTNKLRLTLNNSAAVPVLEIESATAVTNDNNWHHFSASWDLAANVSHLYLDGVSDKVVTTAPIDSPADWTRGGVSVGARPTGADKLNADFAHFYLNTTEYLDLSNAANLAKFIDSNGEPVDLGTDGSIPTGTAPILFLSGGASEFITNQGTGGNINVGAGSLTDSATNP